MFPHCFEAVIEVDSKLPGEVNSYQQSNYDIQENKNIIYSFTHEFRKGYRRREKAKKKGTGWQREISVL